MIVGQCRTDPVTGVAGEIYTLWTSTPDAALSAEVLVEGSDIRNLFAAQVEAFAAKIVASNGGGGPWVIESKSADFVASTGVHYEVDTSGGAVTCTLPDEFGDITFVKTDDANHLIFAGGSIDGDPAAYLDVGDTIVLRYLGASLWRWVV